MTTGQLAAARSADSRISDGDEGHWNDKADAPRHVGEHAAAVFVSWYEAAKFANWLTTGDAHNGAYHFDATGVLTNVLTRLQIQGASRARSMRFRPRTSGTRRPTSKLTEADTHSIQRANADRLR